MPTDASSHEARDIQMLSADGLRDALKSANEDCEFERLQRVGAQVELQKLEVKFKKFRFWALILAAPTLLLLSPIWVPLMLARKLRKGRKATGIGRKATDIIYKAYRKRLTDGSTAAIVALKEREADLPAGTIPLFRAIDAESDETWLKLMNEWSTAQGLPKLSLQSGSGPRFQRIVIEQLDAVEGSDLVTIIVPCYNAESAVRQAIQSVLNQSWKNIEVIAVNDASPDGTGAVLDQMAGEDSRLRVLHNAVNVGPYVSKNRALSLAQGVYVTGHDSDDIALPGRIAEQVASLQANEQAKATIGYMVRLTKHGCFTTPEKSPSRTYDGLARLCPISTMCETSTLRDVLGGWDSVRFGADSELIERMELVLGSQFIRAQNVTMLCLSDAANLTNDPETGINTPTGLSPVRKAYKEAFQAWHNSTLHSDLKIPFPHHPRRFEAPTKMQVPLADVERLMAPEPPQPIG